MQQQAKILYASRDGAAWQLAMLPSSIETTWYPLHQEYKPKIEKCGSTKKSQTFYPFDRSCIHDSFEDFFFNISNINNIIF